MLETLQIFAIIFVSLAMALAFAHALEFPGKLRLSKDQYLAIQPIYFPGFTYAGFSEPASLLVLLVLLIITPTQDAGFWLIMAALIALAAMHAVYWFLTHPLNNFWLSDFQLRGFARRFFAFSTVKQNERPDWTQLRNRWEWSHVIRAALGLTSLVLITAAVVLK